jgi:hypothetical protein
MVAVLVAGCGGGGGDGPAANVAEASGVWMGTMGTQRELTGLLLSDGSYYLVYSAAGKAATGGFVYGTATVDDGTFTSANGIDYNLEGTTPGAALTITPSPVAGEVHRRDVFFGTIRGGTPSSVAFTTAPGFGVSTLAALAGSYAGTVSFALGDRPATFTVTSDGAVSSVINECRISGTVTPRTDIGAYDLTISFGGPPCVIPSNFPFTGIAHLSGGKLIAAVRNTTINQAIVFSGTR